MSSIKKDTYSFYRWNGNFRFSLLVFILINVFFHACISTGHPSIERSRSKSKVATKNEAKTRVAIVSTAMKYKGVRYKYGGKSPSGFDCSGFSQYVMSKNNITIESYSSAQSRQGKLRKIRDLEPGDLIFFGQRGKVTHVGIITYNGKNDLRMIHSSSTRGIIEENIYASTYWTKRIISGRNVLN